MVDALMTERDYFGVALKKARVAEAAQLEAVLNIRDARALRLESLRDAVQLRLGANAQAHAFFDLIVQPGVKPKLWIDLISSVVMEPDPRSYRLVQDRENTIEKVFETSAEKEMIDFLTQYLAHRVVAHDKLLAGAPAATFKSDLGYSLFNMIYVWLTGCLFGVMTLLTIAMYLGILHF